MAEGKKHIALSPEVYKVLLIKTETPVNPITSTINQTQENLNTISTVLEFLKKKRFNCIRRVKQVKKGER